ncbi:MAG TPA: L-threonine 3-dehydrogenase [Candidatus Hydrogenedentes bacterium]|nr:L-threonine 3-dehydrogenase [Candidatus Hydrogenedentota bacterium]
MKAIVKSNPGIGLEIMDVPMPRIGPDDVLIKVKAATICGSDFHIYNWDEQWTTDTIKGGQIVGHEFCGEVADLGCNVTDLARGELVTAEGHIGCGTCYYCQSGQAHICPKQTLIGFHRPGGFAEFIAVPATNIVKLGKLPLIVGTLQDPFGCAVHSTQKVNLTGATVLVTGCGPIGLMTIALAKLAGAQRIFATEKSPYRISMASKIGADLVFNSQESKVADVIYEKTKDKSGVDVLFEMSGTPEGVNQGFKILRPGGTAVLLGLPKQPVNFDFANDLIAKGVTVHGIIGRLIFETWYQARAYINDNDPVKSMDFSKIVTHRMMLDNFDEAFKLMLSGNAGKVILFPDKESLLQSYDELP